MKYFLFNFAITKICVAICSAEDEQESATYSFNYTLVLNTHAVFQRKMMPNLTCVLIYSLKKSVLEDVFKTIVLKTM